MSKSNQIIEQRIKLLDETLVLTNQRAVYWPSKKTLILADVHIGKTGHFRKHGIAIPNSLLREDLDRLAVLLQHYSVNELIIVGDLFHAAFNNDITLFKTWKKKFKTVSFILIKGNHDRLLKKVYQELEIEICEMELRRDPFLLRHDITPESSDFTISGHIHPGVQIKLGAKQRVKLPCYVVTKTALIVPAFSLFTGLNTQKIAKNQDVFAFTEDSFFLIKE